MDPLSLSPLSNSLWIIVSGNSCNATEISYVDILSKHGIVGYSLQHVASCYEWTLTWACNICSDLWLCENLLFLSVRKPQH